ncbi:MAG TPA: response regulator transcription factor [Anaerolineales bacterium]|nr:response regulator transcription factor [Anaerolineales bacterium]
MPLVEVSGSIDPDAISDAVEIGDRAQVLLWDVGLHSDEALDALRRLTEGSPPVVALATDADQAAAARDAGAVSVLPRSSPADVLEVALLAAGVGLDVRDPSFEHETAPRRGPLEDGEALTAREAEVLQLLAEGMANKAIALRLGIRETTVKFHVNSILAKLGAQSRTEAVARAARQGLIFF